VDDERKSVYFMKYQVELTVIKVPVPADELACWKQSVANLYARLEDMVQADKDKERGQGYVQSTCSA
jgi:hypothetical protein